MLAAVAVVVAMVLLVFFWELRSAGSRIGCRRGYSTMFYDDIHLNSDGRDKFSAMFPAIVR